MGKRSVDIQGKQVAREPTIPPLYSELSVELLPTADITCRQFHPMAVFQSDSSLLFLGMRSSEHDNGLVIVRRRWAGSPHRRVMPPTKMPRTDVGDGMGWDGGRRDAQSQEGLTVYIPKES